MKRFTNADLASIMDASARYFGKESQEPKTKRPRFKVSSKDCMKVGSSDLYGTRRYSSFEEKYETLKKHHEEFLKTHPDADAPTPHKVELRIGSRIEVTILGITKRVTITSEEALLAYKDMHYRFV